MLRRTSLVPASRRPRLRGLRPGAGARRRQDLREDLRALPRARRASRAESFAKLGVRSFKDKEWQKATPDAQIEKSIREGKKGTLMASFEKQFSPEEIKALVAYVRKLGGVPAK